MNKSDELADCNIAIGGAQRQNFADECKDRITRTICVIPKFKKINGCLFILIV